MKRTPKSDFRLRKDAHFARAKEGSVLSVVLHGSSTRPSPAFRLNAGLHTLPRLSLSRLYYNVPSFLHDKNLLPSALCDCRS